MEPREKDRPVQKLEKEVEIYHPIRSLFLLDILRDRQSWPVLAWALITLLFGALVYHWIEGWNYIDALYFCVVSLTTIGYGDFVPTTQFGRIFTIIYVINGIVILLSLFDRIRSVRSNRMRATDDH